MVFDDEGHGFRKKENQARGDKAILDFLDRNLKAARPGGPDGVVPASQTAGNKP
jgi:hypothetical protein